VKWLVRLEGCCPLIGRESLGVGAEELEGITAPMPRPGVCGIVLEDRAEVMEGVGVVTCLKCGAPSAQRID